MHKANRLPFECTPVLVFATDGSRFANTGIALLLSAIKGRIFHHIRLDIWIVVPLRTRSRTQLFFSKLDEDSSFNYATAEMRDDDRYFIQLGILNVVDRLPRDAVMLCLDYDHLVLEPSSRPIALPEHQILVSSEVGRFATDELSFELSAIRDSVESVRHLNASLIIARARVLERISGDWKDAYSRISDVIDFRHRVEIALSIAALHTDVTVQPVDADFQGNFAVRGNDCVLFHYGGESEESSELKNRLVEISNLFRDTGPTTAYALELHDNLVAELQHLLNVKLNEFS